MRYLTPAKPIDADKLLATEHLLTSDGWVAEQKFQGVRCLVHVDGGYVAAISRQHKPLKVAPEILAPFHDIAPAGARLVFDCELLRDPAKLFIFDLPEAEGLVTTATPFAQRRIALERVFAALDTDDAPVFLTEQAVGTRAKRALLAATEANGTEGVVFKRLTAAYPAGRTEDMLRVKHRADVDCIVTGAFLEGHANLAVSVYDEAGVLTEVATVSQNGEGAEAARRFLAEQDKPEHARHAVVVTVLYQYASDDRRLVHPTFPTLRDDKAAADCTIDQLRFIDTRAILEVAST